MALAGMLRADEDALVCDFAEVYHVYDWRALRPMYAATLACGLGPDSRTMTGMSGRRLSMSEMLLTLLSDQLAALIFGLQGKCPPDSLMDKLTGTGATGEGSDTADDFEAIRGALLEGRE